MCTVEWLETECFGAFAAGCRHRTERGQFIAGLARSASTWSASPIGAELRLGTRFLTVTLDTRGIVLLNVANDSRCWRQGTAELATTCLVSEAIAIADWMGRLLSKASALPPVPVLWLCRKPAVVWTCAARETGAAREVCLRLEEERARMRRPGAGGNRKPVVTDPQPPSEPTPE
jgi:hypothetical protein